MMFADMAKMMIAKYDSNLRQLQVQGTLKTLLLDKFKAMNIISSHGKVFK